MKRVLVFGVLACALFAPAARASTLARVTLNVSQYDYALSTASCDVDVPVGASGVTVLAYAKSAHCINDYSLEVFTGFGNFVNCIDDGVVGNECGDPAPSYARYWDMRVNCVVTPYGIDDYKAHDGDELSFTYETLVTGTAPAASASHTPVDCLG